MIGSTKELSSVALDSFFAGGTEASPTTALVNGIGRFPGGTAVPWARINVTRGKRYRFRLIGLSTVGKYSHVYLFRANWILSIQRLSNFQSTNTA